MSKMQPKSRPRKRKPGPKKAVPAAAQPTLRSNLSHWQEMHERGYFDSHVFYGANEGKLHLEGDDLEVIGRYVTLSPRARVAVIGCGYGRETVLISPHVKEVYGVDVSPLILEKAREFTASHGVKNFVPVLASNWRDELPNGIDLVYIFVVFQHLTRDLVGDYLSGLREKLSGDGRILAQFLEEKNGDRDADLLVHEPNVSWTPAEIREAVEESGLQLLSLELTRPTPKAEWHWAFIAPSGF